MNTPLFFQRRFLPMWTALSLGAFADNMLRQALIIGIGFGAIHAAGFDNPTIAVPVLGSFFAAAMLIFSSIAGQVAEKYETAMMFRRTKLAEVILMATAALGFAINSGWLLIVTLFSMGAQSAFFSPVRMGAMPKYLKPDELIRGNGFCNAGLYVSILLGLFLGGLLIAREDGTIWLSALLFSASLIGWLAILFAPKARADAPDLHLDWNPITQAFRILNFAFSSPGVARPMLGAAFFYFISTLVTVLAPLYGRVTLGADEAVATAIMGVFAIGAGLGAMTSAALSKKRSGLGFSALGISLAGAAAFGVYFLSGLVPPAEGETRGIAFLFGSLEGRLLTGAFCLSAAFMGLFVVPLQAAVQRRAPAQVRSRIMAASNMMNAAAAFIGSLFVIVIAQPPLGPREAFLFVAAIQILLAAYMLRRRASVPRDLYDEMLAERPAGENTKA